MCVTVISFNVCFNTFLSAYASQYKSFTHPAFLKYQYAYITLLHLLLFFSSHCIAFLVLYNVLYCFVVHCTTGCLGFRFLAFWLQVQQDAQLSQRDRAAGHISFGRKWKTGTQRQYFTDIISLSSTTVT